MGLLLFPFDGKAILIALNTAHNGYIFFQLKWAQNKNHQHNTPSKWLLQFKFVSGDATDTSLFLLRF